MKEEARENTEDTRKTVLVSIMPCTAKNGEVKRPEHFTDGEQDVDYVLTTTEITRMIKEVGIDLKSIEPEAMDMPFGLASGSAAIFGVTGGVTEAVLRRLMNSSKADVLQEISFTGPRTKKVRMEGIYKVDLTSQIKLSNENPIILSLYEGLLKGKEHKLLYNEK